MLERKNILDIVNYESDIANYDDIADTELQGTEIWDDNFNNHDEY